MATFVLYRVSLVTDGGKDRLGRRVALTLAEPGCDIAIYCRTPANDFPDAIKDLSERGVEAGSPQADWTEEASVGRLPHAARVHSERLGHDLDCPIIYERILLGRVATATASHDFVVNVLGALVYSQQVASAMIGQPRGGLISNIGSGPLALPYLNDAVNSISKGGTSDLTHCLAIEQNTETSNSAPIPSFRSTSSILWTCHGFSTNKPTR